MKYIITLNGKQYEVEVEKGQATAVYTGEAQPMVEALAAAAPAPTPAPAAPAASAAPSAPVGAGEPVKAPMPGTILSVSCTKGQAVKSGQVLLVLEAMKMENEITAPKDGTITAVCVTKGSAVETGSVLCTLE